MPSRRCDGRRDQHRRRSQRSRGNPCSGELGSATALSISSALLAGRHTAGPTLAAVIDPPDTAPAAMSCRRARSHVAHRHAERFGRNLRHHGVRAGADVREPDWTTIVPSGCNCAPMPPCGSPDTTRLPCPTRRARCPSDRPGAAGRRDHPEARGRLAVALAQMLMERACRRRPSPPRNFFQPQRHGSALARRKFVGHFEREVPVPRPARAETSACRC